MSMLKHIRVPICIAISALSFSASAYQLPAATDVLKTIDKLTKIVTPGVTTHDQLIKILKRKGCYFAYGERLPVSIGGELDNKKFPIYRYLSEDYGSHGYDELTCFRPLGVDFLNTSDGDFFDIHYKNHLRGNDAAKIPELLEKKFGKGIILSEGRVRQVLFKSDKCSVVLETSDIQELVRVGPRSFYDSTVKAIEEKKIKEESERAEFLEKMEIERRKKIELKAEAENFKGRMLGVITPGETRLELVEEKLSQLNCKISKDGSLVNYFNEPCFTLPGDPTVKINELGNRELVVEINYSGERSFETLIRKLNNDFGRPYQIRVKNANHNMWGDDTLKVLQFSSGSNSAFFFMGVKVYQRLVEEQRKVDALKNKTLENLF